MYWLCGSSRLRKRRLWCRIRVPMNKRMSRSPSFNFSKTYEVSSLEVTITVLKFPQR
jgi:hypothetical protein